MRVASIIILLSACTACVVKGHTGDTAALSIVGEASGPMTLNGAVEQALSGVSYYEDFFYAAHVVALAPWEMGCGGAFATSNDWLGIEPATDGRYFVIIPLDGPLAGVGDVWMASADGPSTGYAAVREIEAIVTDAAPTDTVGAFVDGSATWTSAGEDGSAWSGDVSFRVPYCGEEY
jgi:hypothetical protein